MKILQNLVMLLLIVGGLNWGLVGLWNYDLVVELLGSMPSVVTAVYALVGLAAVLAVVPYVTKLVRK
ncbi:MAG: DUF378 domain-containing protein [Candidatus Peribacteraceae bacterium]|nr:DUF378 domain-containing protein [Candidatus Peribacteraceae bacterium]